MCKELIIRGGSSQKEKRIVLEKNDGPKNLMLFLASKDIPIASSCRGQGICRKCIVSDKVLSCSLSVKDYLEKHGKIVHITYF